MPLLCPKPLNFQASAFAVQVLSLGLQVAEAKRCEEMRRVAGHLHVLTTAQATLRQLLVRAIQHSQSWVEDELHSIVLTTDTSAHGQRQMTDVCGQRPGRV